VKFVRMPAGAVPQGRRDPRAQFAQLQASQLYCPTCKTAMPVREQVALYLPSGNLYHYKCQRCGSILGKKRDGTD